MGNAEIAAPDQACLKHSMIQCMRTQQSSLGSETSLLGEHSHGKGRSEGLLASKHLNRSMSLRVVILIIIVTVSCGHAASPPMSPRRSPQLEDSPSTSPEYQTESYPQTHRCRSYAPVPGQDTAARQGDGRNAYFTPPPPLCPAPDSPVYSPHRSPSSVRTTPHSPYRYQYTPDGDVEYDPGARQSANATPADRVVCPPQPSNNIRPECASVRRICTCVSDARANSWTGLLWAASGTREVALASVETCTCAGMCTNPKDGC